MKNAFALIVACGVFGEISAQEFAGKDGLLIMEVEVRHRWGFS